MNTFKTMLILGIVFMATGATFLILGISTHLSAFWAIGPTLSVLGVAFLAIAVSRKRSQQGPTSASGGEA